MQPTVATSFEARTALVTITRALTTPNGLARPQEVTDRVSDTVGLTDPWGVAAFGPKLQVAVRNLSGKTIRQVGTSHRVSFAPDELGRTANGTQNVTTDNNHRSRRTLRCSLRRSSSAASLAGR